MGVWCVWEPPVGEGGEVSASVCVHMRVRVCVRVCACVCAECGSPYRGGGGGHPAGEESKSFWMGGTSQVLAPSLRRTFGAMWHHVQLLEG